MASVPTAAAPWRIEFGRDAQLKAALVAAAFVLVFWGQLLDLMSVWWNDTNWSHGWVIAPFSAYLVYTRWDRVRSSPIRETWVGLLLLCGSLALFQLTFWALTFTYIRYLAMLGCILGIVIYLCGLPVVRHVWVPWLYLLFAIPLPKEYYFRLTDPLQRIAASVAVWVLSMLDLNVVQSGATLEYFHNGRAGQLEVAHACSGMRSVITLCALGVATIFISDRPVWQRLLMLAACVPIAVFSNVVRVTTTCLLHVYVDPKYAEGEYHTMLGLGTMLLALLMFLGLGWILSNLVVEDHDEDDAAPARAAGR
jgi:exosortase